MDAINRAVHKMAHPSSSSDTPAHEHPAHHGASLEEHDPPSTMLGRVFSNETTKQITSQGNCGQGMDGGLKDKAIRQQERVAERSRLQRDGLFEPHIPHETLVNLSPEHRAVANGEHVIFDNHSLDQFGSPMSDSSPKLADRDEHLV